MSITDRAALGRQYRDSTHLEVRAETHRLYGTGGGRHFGRVLELLDAGPGDLVCDVGCGPGARYQGELTALGATVIGVDLSRGMLLEARARCLPVRADAQALPVRSESVDRVLCAHALYHVPDRTLALQEMRRVLRSGGRVALTTNASEFMQDLYEVVEAAWGDIGRQAPPRLPSRFTTEDIDLVRAVFPDAELEVFPGQLTFPGPEPAIRYLATTSTIDDGWSEAFRRRVDAIVARQGAFQVRTGSGCFIASTRA